MLHNRLIPSVLAAACILCFAGRAAVAGETTVFGKITVDGKPVVDGKVIFHNADGEFVGAKVAKDGSYSFNTIEVPPGMYKVTIEGKGVPAKYGFPDASGLTYEIRAGRNNANFELVSQ